MARAIEKPMSEAERAAWTAGEDEVAAIYRRYRYRELTEEVKAALDRVAERAKQVRDESE